MDVVDVKPDLGKNIEISGNAKLKLLGIFKEMLGYLDDNFNLNKPIILGRIEDVVCLMQHKYAVEMPNELLLRLDSVGNELGMCIQKVMFSAKHLDIDTLCYCKDTYPETVFLTEEGYRVVNLFIGIRLA